MAPESELVERARGGDTAAFGTLVRAHEDVAFRTAYLICGSAADAEDAAQEGFVRAHRALDRFRPDAPFRPWLLAIVANEARNRRRAEGRRVALAQRAVALAEAAPGGRSAEAEAVEREQRGALLEALGGLREDDRLVVSCRYLLELGEEETAAVLGIPRGTVKSRLHRALGRLRERLEGADTIEEGEGA